MVLVILDVGCGRNPFPLANITIDINPQVRPTIVADQGYLPIRSNVIDYVYSSHSIEHSPPRDIEKIIREFHRVLKLGGILNLRFPNVFSPFAPSTKAIFHKEHKSFITSIGIALCLLKTGFRRIQWYKEPRALSKRIQKFMPSWFVVYSALLATKRK